MHDAIPLAGTGATPRLGRTVRAAWRGAGRMFARLNGTTAAGIVDTADFDQLRRAMRD